MSSHVGESIQALLVPGSAVSPAGIHDNLVDNLFLSANQRFPGILSRSTLESNPPISVTTPHERFVISVADEHPNTQLPARVFIGASTDEELEVFGCIEGPQHEKVPFVGMIETLPEYQRQHKAARMLGIMNIASRAIYGQPITSGSKSYLSEDGAALQQFAARRYGLSTNDAGFVVGR